jgi:chemotaxis protein MotB
MAKKKRGDAHGGGHGWFVTFADLMGLMMSFFVMLVAFSTMDNNKLKIVAGSMRDAFGVQTNVRYSGIIESDGLPTRPELTEVSKHIMFEETKEGLNLEIVDQDGRSMFADGSKEPYDRTRRLIQKLAAPLKATPLRVSIVGHTAAGFVPARSDYGAFDLSADRANVVRQILEREGLPSSHVFAVSGKADGQPLFPDDPTLPANRRVTITLMRENPPLPPDLKP